MIGIELFLLGVLQFLRTYNHLTHNLCHDRLGLVGSLLNLLMGNLNGDVEATQVGDNRNTKGADAAVVSHDNLRNGAHTYGVATQDAVHLILCWSFEGRTLDAHVDTILQTNLLLACNLAGQFDKRLVVGLVHIRETGTGGEVLSAQRMLGEEIDMVGNHHQVTNLEARIHATGSIRDEEGLDTQFVHYTYGEGNLLHRIPLVEVETAFHSHDIHTAKLTEDKLAAMTFYRRNGEVGYFTIGYLKCVSYF